MVRWSLLAAPGGEKGGTRAGVSARAAAAPAGRGGGHGGILRRRRHGAGVAAEVSGARSAVSRGTFNKLSPRCIEQQRNVPGAPDAILGNDQVYQIGMAVLVVAMEKRNDVGVLLN